jgi:hypothetical protein
MPGGRRRVDDAWSNIYLITLFVYACIVNHTQVNIHVSHFSPSPRSQCLLGPRLCIRVHADFRRPEWLNGTYFSSCVGWDLLTEPQTVNKVSAKKARPVDNLLRGPPMEHSSSFSRPAVMRLFTCNCEGSKTGVPQVNPATSTYDSSLQHTWVPTLQWHFFVTY